MSKPKYLFLISLYAITGLSGWLVYENVHLGREIGVEELEGFAEEVVAYFDSSPAATLNRWQDDKGRWHYDEQPPAPQANIHKTATIRATAEAERSSHVDAQIAVPATLNEVYSFDRILQLLEDARNVENLLQARKQTMDEAIKAQSR